MHTGNSCGAILCRIWVEFDNNIKISYIKLLNKAFENNLKYIIEDDMEFIPDSIKIILEKN